MTTSSTFRNRVWLVLLWVVFYASFTLFVPPLLDDADSVHAEVAREMVQRHDWVTLYANGIRYLEKAPILYWSMAASFKMFGVSTAAARVPLALTVLALCLFLESFARGAFGSARAGLYAGLITLSSFGIFIFTRITIPDADVCLWLALAMLAFWTTEETEEVPLLPCLVFAAACALNVLTKGLIGIVFPVAIVAIYLVLTRGFRGAARRLGQLHPGMGVLVFLVIAAPWHILIGLANPTQGHPGGVAYVDHHWQVPLPTDGNVHGWFWFYFVNEHVLRYLNLRVPRDYDTVPLALFWGLLLVWLMPWSAYLFHAVARVPLWRAVRRFAAGEYGGDDRAKTRLLLGVWGAVPLLFFSLSTRQEYYVLPALPALILLIAAWLAESSLWKNAGKVRSDGGSAVGGVVFSVAETEVTRAAVAAARISSVLFGLGTVASIALGFFLVHSANPAADTDLASLLQQNPGDYALSFGHFLDLNAQALGLFRLPLALTAAALFLGTFANWSLRRKDRPHGANLALAGATFVFLLAAHLGLQIFSPVLSSARLAEAIAPRLQRGDLIVLHGEYEAGSTLGFYLQRDDLHLCEGRSSNLWYGSFFPDAPKIFESRESVAAKWGGAQRIFLWQDPSDKERPVLTLPAPVYVIARSGGKEVLSNRP